MADQASSELAPVEREEWPALVARAEKGDAAALAEVRARLAAQPELCQEWGGIERRGVDALLQATGCDRVSAEALRLEIASLRDELAGPNPSPLVRLAAAHAALCHFETLAADIAGWLSFRSAYDRGKIPSSTRVLDYFGRRSERAARRLNAALRTLALLRRVPLSIVLNVAEKQVNVLAMPLHADTDDTEIAPLLPE